MKKSLKALILCGLASLVMFAVVYESPITAQAATQTQQATIVLENSNPAVNIGTGTITYDDAEVLFNGFADVVGGYWLNTTEPALLVEVDAHPINNSNVTSIPFDYDFTLNGSRYTGRVYLSVDNINNPTYYYFLGSLISDTGATGYGKVINDLENKIGNISNDATLTGENRVIEFNEGTALPGNIIGAMANSQNVTLKFTFVYDGYEFCTTITSEDAKRLNNAKIEWWGPCYLAENFPTVWTGKTVK